eukprot:TRINITY_DN345_c0_g1_i4.p1 TRINITY_DN345_c0_g1~~TRINITY_DN345_c0_g1_i4.p1  ORF type:complete len:522 (-),score=74.89 TRINITY_DN345_c0_g1_i4:2325-3890(-)
MITEDEFYTTFPEKDCKIGNPDADQRINIVNELYESEKRYLSNLRICYHLHYSTLIHAHEHGMIGNVNKSVIDEIFEDLEQILIVNTQLLNDLEECLEGWNEESTIGNILIEIIPCFGVYKKYTSSYGKKRELVRDCMKDSWFSGVMDRLLAHPLSEAHILSSFLIQPVQRIPRYTLLIEDLIKSTSESHPDHSLLEEALNISKEVADRIDKSIKHEENQAKCLAIQRIIGNEFQVVDAHRRYIFEGDVYKKCRKVNKLRRFWLFSDILLYGRLQQRPTFETKYNLSRCFNLSTLVVTDLDDEQSDVPNSIKFSGPSKSFIVFSNSAEEKEEWLIMIGTAIDQHHNSLGSLQRKSSRSHGSIAPLWIPDKEASNCMQCNRKFSMIQRKHHCRRCGKCICGRCSSNRVLLPFIHQSTKVRVCIRCFEEQIKRKAVHDLQPLKLDEFDEPEIEESSDTDEEERKRRDTILLEEGFEWNEEKKRWSFAGERDDTQKRVSPRINLASNRTGRRRKLERRCATRED